MSRSTSDVLRLVSIVAVFIIHATSAFEHSFHKFHNFISQDFLGVIMNQWGRFSVPVFVILSGYGLGMKYGGLALGGWKGVLDFYRSRADKIAVPYLFWSLILLALGGKFVLAYTNAGDLDAGSSLISWGRTYVDALFFHHADYHFYFFLIILECYLLFPILIRIDSAALWIVMLVSQILFTSPAHLWFNELGIHRPDFPSSFVLFWAFYFYTGILTARRGPALAAWAAKTPALVSVLVAVAALATLLWEYVFWSYRTPEPDYYNHFHRQSVIVYGLAVWFLFIRWDQPLAAFLKARPKLSALTATGSALSFAGFIFHTQILRVLNLTPLAWNVLVLSAALIGITFGILYAAGRFVKNRTIRVILGLP